MKFAGRLKRLGPKGTWNRRPAQLVVFVAAFAAIGTVLIVNSRAATPVASFEAEAGTRSGNVAQVADAGASGGNAVKFGTPGTGPQLAGVFITRTELDRAKARAVATTEPFRTSYNVQKGRADSALSSTPSPFYMERSNYLANIRWAWSWSSCPDNNPSDNNSVADAVSKLENQGDTTRTLAMQYALTGDVRYADKAKQYLLAWSNGSTPVNMYDFFVNTTTFDGGLVGDNGTTCHRPWNMALDGLFQGYGLTNFADAYALLTLNGYTLNGTDNTAIRNYLYQLTAAVNSSYHAWSRWADKHNCTPTNTSETCTRYRSDNHLSWGQAPILAAAAALQDQTIANYVLNGGTWDDGRSGPVANTSHMKYVLNRAILSTGQIYDEAPASVGGIERDGYAFYALWAMQIAARADDVNFGQGLWDYKGTDGKGLQEAYQAESARVFSGQNDGDNWQYELVYNRWPTSTFLDARNASGRTSFIAQSFGPVVLLFGQ
jgi:hypothetical protein